MFKLWRFNGGVHLRANKQESSLALLNIAPLPKTLIYPLLLRYGRCANTLVAPGQRVLKGQVIIAAEGPMNPPVHAASSGWVSGVEQRLLPHPSGLYGGCAVIEVDGLDEAVEFQGFPNFEEMEPDELRGKIHAAGIVGLGGAAFPTAVKINPPKNSSIETLVLNGAECEPYISCDDSLLRHCAYEVMAGALIVMRILKAARCLLAIEDDKPEAVAVLQKTKAEGDFGTIEIVTIPSIYPTGGERQLIKVLTGKEVPADGIPAQVGVVCQNVATVAAVYNAITKGEPLISRIVTVTGRGVRRPQNLLARIGAPLSELVELCGGYTDSAHRLIMGGPMMGFALPTDEVPMTKSTNCILVAGQGDMAGEKQAMPCIRCGACATACPVNLLPQQLYWYSCSGNLDRLLDYRLQDCIECGCCDVVCPSHIALVQYFRSSKSKMALMEIERLKADRARLRYEAKLARKEQEKLEKAESAKRKKELLATAFSTSNSHR